ncbi:hypothetical protein CK203_027361 [Vitis vinifera]|uniref:Uncharacterized protein n=1 Tax=Vitis vinifera TaxID=29760 RepID=A0A438J9D0_VITVI|nr:hypothetical protein CK203_027361 [Vitis vinifera]
MINSSPTRNFRKGKEFYCMTQDSISFLGSSIKVDRPVHYSPSISNGVVELLNSNGKDTFKVNGYSSQAIHGAIQTIKGGDQPP